MTGVSVIIPCRNAEAWIAQTVRSALAQHLPPHEIIVVDDGSTDRSAEIAEGFGPPVWVIRAAASGANAARRRGAAEATGRFLVFLDADDLLTPDTLGALVRALGHAAAEPAVALCPWDRYEAVRGLWLARPPTNKPAAPWADPLSAWLRDAWSPPCAVMWTTEGYALSGGWDEDFAFDQDGDLMRRAFARGVRVIRTEEGLALYRRVPRSVSSRRRTAEGATAAMDALDRLADELEAAGSTGRYRAALVAAADAAARRTGAGPGLLARADALAARLGGRRSLDRPGARAYALAARATAAWAPRLAGAVPDRRDPAGGSRERNEQAPLVTVVIPTHERPALTVAAVESALAQTWQNTEVVVVDDASGDDTPDRLREIDDPRLRVIVQPENRGVAAARNAGIAAARGDMIAFLDSDDVWRPEKIARQARALAAAPAHVGLCQCGSETMARDGGTIIHRPEAGGRMFVALLRQNVLHGGGSTVMVRREVTEAIGGFDEGLPAAEDWEFFQRAARLFDVTCVPEPLAVIRDDTPGPRRSARFRANMDARAAIFSRNRHALRRARVAHLFLIDSSRRELRSPEGSARRGVLLALRAIAERPFARSAWVQMRHCLALRRLGRQLRAAISRPRRMMGQLEPTKTVAPSTGVADQHGSR